ncbi:hypothetical protein [Ohessyouella blattaphilus]|jgi:hypothetical protein|uniref:ErpK protein n=1 Tax=Ohessyouella blattaphilus TaxID=2949333 RepID=A0ABT1EL97_9FIRM|nr:hypothetical protein [Ohessyouella blattaphilus]MCP1110562.1 hypothetical protein [Ohessyouella blattaphilus]MCR8563956.1 hypothetical protein [Ohessyouella blattaphilus]NCC11380.1 hypothetical protein [Bacteroidia bacterium]NCD10547.1 hypothetical protein [Negativicutes bacterium]
MARTTSPSVLDKKIIQAQENVIKYKERYDSAVEVLAKLQEKKAAIRNEELLSAFEKSDRTYEEVMSYLSSKVKKE